MSDDHLAGLAIPMEDGGWWDGLGPFKVSRFEVETSEQFMLVRREGDLADVVEVWGSLWIDVEPLLDRLMNALSVPVEAVAWTQSQKDRDYMRRLARDWLKRHPPPTAP